MKLLSVFLLVVCLQAAGSGKAQRISLSVKNAPLKTIFKEVKRQTGFSFLYSSELARQSPGISMDVKNATLEEVLNICTAGRPIAWEIENKVIIMKPVREEARRPDLPTADKDFERIKGRIVDQDNKPMRGATILVKGTNVSTLSASDGSFDFDPKVGSGILIITYVGHKPQEIAFNSDSRDLVVKMTLDESTVGDNIVLVGYGKMKKRDITGSVSGVKEADIQSRPVTNFYDALIGRASGVSASQQGGDLNGKLNVTIRGAGAITTGTGPIVIIDGVPSLGSFNAINPKDIVSIDILKDASAASIYGAQASNGVILVTTRRGKAGKAQVTVSSDMAYENVAKFYKLLSTEQQRKLFIDAFKNSSMSASAIAPFENTADPVWQIDNDWQKLATRTALRQNYNLQISGGTEKSRYAISGGYLKRQGVIKNTDITNYFFRSNNDMNIGEKLKVTSSLMATYEEYNKPQNENDIFNNGGLFQTILGAHSYNPTFDANGNLAGIAAGGGVYFGNNSNPLIPIYLFKNITRTTRITGNLRMDYELAKGLTAATSLGTDFSLSNSYAFYPKYTIGLNKRDPGTTSSSNYQLLGWTTDFTLGYQKKISDHEVKLLVGTSIQKTRGYGTSILGTGTTDNNLNQISNQTTITASSSDASSSLVSTFARLNYGYANRYLVTGTVRRDGSSKFGPANRFGIFPSGSVAWRASEESFFPKNVISDLKFRVSYGITGNQSIPDFAFMGRVAASNYVFGNANVAGYVPGNLSNPDLQWESAKQFDAGVDISVLNGRLNLTADYYERRSTNLLIDIPLPYTAAITTQTTNFGSILNKGTEFSINSINVISHSFKWVTDFNISFNKNEVLDAGTNSTGKPLTINGITFASPVGDHVNLTAAGQPVGAFYTYQFDGIWQTNQAAEAAVYGLVPGDVRYVDVVKDGKINQEDKVYVGSPQPKYFGGLNNTFTYKNISLNVFFNFSGGNKVYNALRNLNARAVPFNQQLAEVANYWTPTNPSNTIPRPSQGGSTTVNTSRASTRFLEDGSYIRLKNISLAYDLPASLLSKLKLQGARFAISCINAYTWTKYTGLDPEAASGGNLLSGGLDITPYPSTRQVNLSLALTF